MGTRAELRARILNELKRPALVAEADLAINDAISYYGPKRLWFNEGEGTIATAPGTESYPLPSDFLKMILLTLTDGGTRYELESQWDWPRFRWYSTWPGTALGTPDAWCIFGDKLWLYPTPAEAGTVTLSYVKKLAPIDDLGTNEWTDEAEPLIRARAKADLFANVIRAYDEAQAQTVIEQQWLNRLQARTRGHGRSGIVQPTCW